MRQEIKHKNKKIIFLIPEQSSFENEKILLEILGDRDFSDIKVLSFSRLFDFVFGSLQMAMPCAMSETTQLIIMSQALESLKDNLKIYKNASSDINLAKLLIETIKELKSNNIDENKLKSISSLCKRDILKQKIEEIILISKTYENFVPNNLKHSLDSFSMLENVIKESNFFKDYIVLINEFSNFTEQQYLILEVMLKQAKDVYMAFCTENLIDANIKSYSLFSPVDKTINKIKRICQKSDIKIERPIFLNKVSDENYYELELLEENIFKSNKTCFKKPTDKITIYNALNLNEETEYIAQMIKKIVIENNYRYQDIMILTRDIQTYSDLIKNSLKRYDIPCFADLPEKLFNKNITNLILGAFDIIHNNYILEDVLRYLKSGLVGISSEEVSIIENYVFMWGIKSHQWKQDFSAHPKGYYKEFEQKDIENLKLINDIRKRIVEPLENFRKKIHSATGYKISRAICELLKEINVAENLKNFCKELENSGDYQIAEKYALLWDNLMEILNQMNVILENIKISSKKYAEIFTFAINFVDCSYIPQCVDNVVIASVERAHISKKKVVFVVGAINGEFPKIPSGSEIFTDQEVNYISELGVNIKENTESFLAREKFLAYNAVSSACEKLFVSWPSADSFKKIKFPSEIIKEIKEIFPNIKILSRNNISNEKLILSYNSAFEVYAKNKNESSVLTATLEDLLYSDEEYKEKCSMIENILNKDRLSLKKSDSALNLYGKNIKLSASQIEKYYTCKFAYFCKYGLKIKVKQPIYFDALDYGTLIHFLFEKLLKKYSDNKIANINEELLSKEIDIFLEDYINKNLGGFENKPKFFIYTLERLKKSIIFLVKHISEEFKQCEFKVLDTELEISRQGDIKPLVFTLPSGKKIFIEGKIDRADIMQKDSLNFIRIIDYKTGNKQFKLSDVFYGLNLQMLIYLLSIQKNGIRNYKNIIPAGILYFTALKPVIEVSGIEDLESLENEIKKKLKMNGLVLENESVIKGMEKEAKGEFIPSVIKNGEIKKSDSIINLKQLEIVYNHIEKLVTFMAENLFSGKMEANPIISKNSTACKWCKYHSICGYEAEKFIKIPSLTNEETLEKMKRNEILNEK